jgi:hypothetical protein
MDDDKFWTMFYLRKGQTLDLGKISLVREGIKLKMTISDATGKPVTDAVVYLVNPLQFHERAIMFDPGVYRLDSVFWHPYPSGSAIKVKRGEALFVFEYSDWKPWTEQEVRITLPDRCFELKGTVTHLGTPFTGAKVYLYLANQLLQVAYWPPALTGQKGEFSFRNLPPGDYELYVVHPELPVVEKTVSLKRATEVEISVPAGQQIVGTVEVKLAGISMRKIPWQEGPMKSWYYSIFLCDEQGHLRRPVVPLCKLEDAAGTWRFSLHRPHVSNWGLTFAPTIPLSAEDLKLAGNYTKISEYHYYEGIALASQMPIATEISKRLTAQVQRAQIGKPLSLRVELSEEEVRKLAGITFLTVLQFLKEQNQKSEGR